MLNTDTTVRVFVGTDRSQLLAVNVLEYSIARHTNLVVEVTPMLDLPLPEPRDPRQGQRTGFSFARFAIPQLAGYHGRGVYLDADMLVFRDIEELWNIPFNGARVVIQEDIPSGAQASSSQLGAPKERIKQTSVMLLDCERLDWDPVEIVRGLDGKYTYEQLMFELCILEPDEIHYDIPFRWNSLEHHTEDTGLLHYTDMYTQPWVSPFNPIGYLWHREARRMLDEGALQWANIEEEIRLGYFRPSLLNELEEGPLDSYSESRAEEFDAIDRELGFVKHKEVYDAKRARKKAIKAFEFTMGSN